MNIHVTADLAMREAAEMAPAMVGFLLGSGWVVYPTAEAAPLTSIEPKLILLDEVTAMSVSADGNAIIESVKLARSGQLLH